MLFNSMDYLIFFPIVLMVYFLLPKKVRYIWLLCASYYFYMCWYPRHVVLLLLSTVITYLGALLTGLFHRNVFLRKACFIACIAANIAMLAYFKYRSFLLENILGIFAAVGITVPVPDITFTLPIGISFYIFQALGYLIDVYRGNIDAEKNFFRYALFVSFFPQLVAGPIERSGNLLRQIRHPSGFNVENVKDGLLTMAYGLFIKVVIADNIAAVIDPIYAEYRTQSGAALVLATVLFAFQIYCDFEGYTKLAIGSARILGFSLMNNFTAPYMAQNVKQFWARWHISLTSWFRDYLYIPLGGNRKGKVRKYINTLIVFLVSGLWHGAGWHYIVWGGINGILIVLHDLIPPQWKDRIFQLFRIDTKRAGWKIFSTAATFALIDFTWLFFRSDSIKMGIGILQRIFCGSKLRSFGSPAFWTGFFPDTVTMLILMVSLFLVMYKDYLLAKGISLKARIRSQQLVFRWIVYLSIIAVIIFGGVYGEGYEQTQFIYFQF